MLPLVAREDDKILRRVSLAQNDRLWWVTQNNKYVISRERKRTEKSLCHFEPAEKSRPFGFAQGDKVVFVTSNESEKSRPFGYAQHDRFWLLVRMSGCSCWLKVNFITCNPLKFDNFSLLTKFYIGVIILLVIRFFTKVI